MAVLWCWLPAVEAVDGPEVLPVSLPEGGRGGLVRVVGPVVDVVEQGGPGPGLAGLAEGGPVAGTVQVGGGS